MALLADPTFVIVAVGALVGISGSLLGTFLVLRRSAMLSDAISHSVLLGIVLAYLASGDAFSPLLLLGAALAGLGTVALTGLLESSGRVRADAAIGLVFPFLFAVAVLLINLFARDVHLDEHAVLLGEIGFTWLDRVELLGVAVPESLLALGLVTLLDAAFVLLFFKELKLSTFDPALAAALGFAPLALHYALLGLTSVTAVAAFDAVGSVLFVAFVIVPAAAAYLLTDRLAGMILISALFSVLSSLIGYVVAVWLDVSIGGAMASATGLFLLLALLLGPRYGLLGALGRRRTAAASG